jgi:hypothetical protein
VKDSTLLIKSIRVIWDKGSSDEDSVIENYSYDTVNRTITILWRDENENFIADGSRVVLSYNEKGLLVKATYNYPPGYIPWDFDYDIIDLSYDAEDVLQNITTRYSNGSEESVAFTKTTHPGGEYQLTWHEESSDTGDSTFRRVEFDKQGNAFINYAEIYYYPSPGAPDRYRSIVGDSITYDAGGSATKIFRKTDYNGTADDLEYTFYEYTRHAKGDQLFNQRQVLLNGIANIPFGDLDNIAADGFGFFSFGLEYESRQYSKYPVQMVKARMWDGTFKNFTSKTEFDNKNRLTKFTGFFQDYDLEPTEYTISYYK